MELNQFTHYSPLILIMYISCTFLVALTAIAGLSSARNIETHKASHRVKGRAFDHFLQIWFENEVKTFKQAT